MKLRKPVRVGFKYKMRNGQIAFIVVFKKNIMGSYIGLTEKFDGVLSWNRDGSFYPDERKDPYDLVKLIGRIGCK